MSVLQQSAYYLIFVIGGAFSLVAALLAYLLTYNEYIHHYKTSKEPRKLAENAAIVAFIFFLVLTLIIGFILVNYLY